MNGRSAPRTTEVIRLVARREVTERLRSKSFYLFTGLLVAVFLALGLISRLAGGGGEEATEVGITEPAPGGLAGAIEQTAELAGLEAVTSAHGDAEAARAALDEGEVDVAVLTAEDQVVFAGAVDDQTFAIIQQAWSGVETRLALAEAGVPPAQVDEILSATPLEAVSLDGGTDDDTGLAVLTGTMAGILLFVSLQTFGGYVLAGVVEEKSTAVVEVLLVRARADQMLAGKVIGIGVAALLQFVLAVAAGLVALVISGVDVPRDIWSTVPMTVVWFLGGYALYSTLFALAGSLVSRQEDAQAASAPILSVLIGAYMLIFYFGYVPESTASRVLSLIPPIAPLLMPMRMAAGAASVVEVVVALVLLAAATIAVWKLAGKIYEQVLLRRGSRISWRDAAALVRHG